MIISIIVELKNRIFTYIKIYLIAGIVIVIANVFASGKGEKNTFSNSITLTDTASINISDKKANADTIIYYAPEFLRNNKKGFLEPYRINDSIFKYEFYDDRDSIIDSFSDFYDIGFISLIKSYTDSLHTYIDKDNKKQFLPIANIIKRYDRIDSNKWICIDYSNNKFMKLKELQTVNVVNDTIKTYLPEKDSMHVFVFSYYKVVSE